MSTRKLRTGTAVTILVASALSLAGVAPASADPSTTPDANDVVGVGSDTIEFVLNDLATGYNATLSGSDPAKLASWNATGPAGETWKPRAGAPTYTRPNGSGKGKAALWGSSNIPEVDFARSSSKLSDQEIANGLVQYPFAVDGLKMAVSGSTRSHAPASISPDTLLKIYNGTYKHWDEVPGGTSTAAIHPYIPQSGSGTRNFFEAQLSALKGATWTTSDYGTASGDYPGVRDKVDTTLVQEHDPALVEDDPDAIAPFSTARQHTLSDPSSVRLEDGFSASRAVYDVVRGTDTGKAWVGAIFGPSGFLCSPAGKTIIEKNGFAQLASTANGGICGQGGTAPATNLTTNTVTTTTTLTGASTTGRAADLTATVDAGGQVPDGEVDFYEGSTQVGTGLLTAGKATSTITGLTPGSHTFTARYVSGNPAAFTDSTSSAVPVTVRETSSTALALSPTTGTYGHARSATVTVTSGGASGTGSVSLAVGGTTVTGTLSSGKAVLAVPTTLPAGTYTATARYAGSSTAAPSSATGQLVVGRSSSTMSESFPATVLRGKRATGVVRVALSPASSVKPTGSVVVKKGTAVIARGTLRNGAWSVTLPALRRGVNNLTMSYAGSTSVLASSKAFTITQR